MNYNQFSSIELEILQDKFNTRAKLDTGTHCNYECSFCYYLDKLDVVTDVEIIKARAKKLYDFGMTEIDLSGGESSIHRNWFEILDYCKELGFKNISALTNGFKFANIEFLKKSQDHGLSELLFSLHGWDSESHAKIVNRKGSFERMLEAIKNCQFLGIKVRINCTVTSFNAPHLDEYVKLVNEIKPFQMNFLPLNYWEDAQKVEPESYELLSEHIKKAIDHLNQEIEINVRYIPYCFMQGYEKYVVGIYQHIFDRGDWNIIAYDIERLPEKPATIEDYFSAAKTKRVFSYTKEKECFNCKFFNICDGIEHKLRGFQAVQPIEGEKVTDVQLFRRGHYPEC